MEKVFSGENMHVLEKGTYVALGGFAVAMLARCRKADIGSRTTGDGKIEFPQTIGQGIALCDASAPFLEEARLH
jgi:hypothetical protein